MPHGPARDRRSGSHNLGRRSRVPPGSSITARPNPKRVPEPEAVGGEESHSRPDAAEIKAAQQQAYAGAPSRGSRRGKFQGLCGKPQSDQTAQNGGWRHCDGPAVKEVWDGHHADCGERSDGDHRNVLEDVKPKARIEGHRRRVCEMTSRQLEYPRNDQRQGGPRAKLSAQDECGQCKLLESRYAVQWGHSAQIDYRQGTHHTGRKEAGGVQWDAGRLQHETSRYHQGQ